MRHHEVRRLGIDAGCLALSVEGLLAAGQQCAAAAAAWLDADTWDDADTADAAMAAAALCAVDPWRGLELVRKR